MKRILLIVVILAALSAGLIFAFLEMRKEVAMEMQGEAPVVPESRTGRDSAGDVVILLDAATQKRMALATAPVMATNFSAELRGYARVLDPLPLTIALADIAFVEAALSASTNELKRARTLFAQDQNISARILEQAEAGARRDQLALDSARSKLMATFGKHLATRPNLPALAQSLAALDAALIRVELPAGDELPRAPEMVRLASSGNSTNSIEAHLVGPAPSVEPQTQGQAFIYLAQTNTGRLTPGQSLGAFIPLTGKATAGVLLPSSAVLRADGKLWAYVQVGETNFVRRILGADRPINDAWFVTNGVAAGEHVVITGAQTLLSEEFKASIPVLAD